MAKPLDVQDRLEYARCAVALLRALAIAKTKMRYEVFARAIGLIPDKDPWEVQYRDQVTAILRVAAAVEKEGLGGRDADVAPLEFDWVVGEDGKPGAGIVKTSRIVTD
jgi:hypothetical protein